MTPALRLVPEGPAGVSPLLKWAGGKRWFVKEYGDSLFDHVLHRGGTYYEPFLGGAAMALHLGLGNMVLGDVEPDLITTYKVIRDTPGALGVMLELLSDCGKGEKTYYHVRKTKPNTPIEIAARLIYLNKLCYNGLYRKNKKKGEFNVPYAEGAHKRTMPSYDQIFKVSKALSGADLRNQDFAELIGEAGQGDTIYVDPPYHDTFVGYTANGFTEADQERLAEALRGARERGAEFFAHNSDTDKVRHWYGSWAEIVPTEERRNVNSNGKGRGPKPCVLIVGAQLNGEK